MYIFPLSIFIFILYPDIARASSSVIPIVTHLGYRHSYTLHVYLHCFDCGPS